MSESEQQNLDKEAGLDLKAGKYSRLGAWRKLAGKIVQHLNPADLRDVAGKLKAQGLRKFIRRSVVSEVRKPLDVEQEFVLRREDYYFPRAFLGADFRYYEGRLREGDRLGKRDNLGVAVFAPEVRLMQVQAEGNSVFNAQALVNDMLNSPRLPGSARALALTVPTLDLRATGNLYYYGTAFADHARWRVYPPTGNLSAHQHGVAIDHTGKLSLLEQDSAQRWLVDVYQGDVDPNESGYQSVSFPIVSFTDQTADHVAAERSDLSVYPDGSMRAAPWSLIGQFSYEDGTQRLFSLNSGEDFYSFASAVAVVQQVAQQENTTSWLALSNDILNANTYLATGTAKMSNSRADATRPAMFHGVNEMISGRNSYLVFYS